MENKDGMQNSGPRSEAERMELPGVDQADSIEIEPPEEIDIYLFKKSLDEKLRIFIERRKQYGSHVENSKRFPLEHIAGVYMKACRTIRDIEKVIPPELLKDMIKDDTLLDLSNYCDIVLSGMMGDSETDK